MRSLPLPVRGAFSLAESTRFLEGCPPARYRGSPGDGGLRLAFPVEGTGETVGVSVRQDPVVVRGAGAPDVFPTDEGRLHAAMAERYGLVAPTPRR
jgi:hypothetical protein